jgi:hypothetical protein
MLDIPQLPRLIIQRDVHVFSSCKGKVDISRKKETVLPREEQKTTDQYNFILTLFNVNCHHSNEMPHGISIMCNTLLTTSFYTI